MNLYSGEIFYMATDIFMWARFDIWYSGVQVIEEILIV